MISYIKKLLKSHVSGFFGRGPLNDVGGLKIYNTMTRSLEVFVPQNSKEVSFYSCGPTVYDYAHIGNLRAYITNDVVKRALRYDGYTVKHVTNITDVGHLVSDADSGEDKMAKGLKREGLDFSVDSMLKLAELYTNAFLQNLRDLHIEEFDVMPRATMHVPEMIEIVDALIKKGYVYETSTAFYFDTTQFPEYGKLGNLSVDELKAGARVEVDSEKKHPADFAVWMKAVGDNASHVMVWSAPFSKEKGFPGWHIECSAMSMKYLGQTIDIHSGGIDHIKVHHTNEIAQSEAFTGKPFVRYWIHNEFIVLDNAKMSKSAGTFIRLQDLIDKGFNPLAYRFLVLGAHYRSPLNFSWDSLAAAQAGYENLLSKVQSLTLLKNQEINKSRNQNYSKRFSDFINNDFDTPKALALVYEVLKDATLSNEEKYATILDFDRVLGLGLDAKKIEIVVPQEIIDLANQRLEAKKNKDYKKADEIRERVNEKGFQIKDTADGFEVVRD